jgi:hypothetical protein
MAALANDVLAQLNTIVRAPDITPRPVMLLALRQACYRLLKTAEQIAGHSADENALGDVLRALLTLGRQLEESLE